LVKFGVTQPAAETSWFDLFCISFKYITALDKFHAWSIFLFSECFMQMRLPKSCAWLELQYYEIFMMVDLNLPLDAIMSCVEIIT
jgi:hypothetical protein